MRFYLFFFEMRCAFYTPRTSPFGQTKFRVLSRSVRFMATLMDGAVLELSYSKCGPQSCCVGVPWVLYPPAESGSAF